MYICLKTNIYLYAYEKRLKTNIYLYAYEKALVKIRSMRYKPFGEKNKHSKFLDNTSSQPSRPINK